MENCTNFIRLCGNPVGKPHFSHMTREGAVYIFPLSVERLSGAEDIVNIAVLREKIAELPADGDMVTIEGSIRSFNNRSGVGPRLVITVWADKIEFSGDEFDNLAALTGIICKPTVFRRTPMGREICDMMVAINRQGGRSDYIPCIAWGALAETAAEWEVGTEIDILGRLQSRKYVKSVDGELVEKTAYEVSAVQMGKR